MGTKVLRHLIALSVFLFSFFISLNVYAANLHSGFYVGAGASSNWTSLKSSRTVSYVGFDGPTAPDLSFSADSKTALGAEIKAGYQRFFAHGFLAGAEVTANFARPQAFQSYSILYPMLPTAFYAQGQVKDTYAANILFGHTITPSTALYLRGGVAMSPTYFDFQKIGDQYRYDKSRNKNLWGPQIGVGVEHQFTQHLMMSVDYDYTFYSSQHYSSQLATIGGNPNLYSVSNKSYRLNNQAVMVTLNYVF